MGALQAAFPWPSLCRNPEFWVQQLGGHLWEHGALQPLAWHPPGTSGVQRGHRGHSLPADTQQEWALPGRWATARTGWEDDQTGL